MAQIVTQTMELEKWMSLFNDGRGLVIPAQAEKAVTTMQKGESK